MKLSPIKSADDTKTEIGLLPMLNICFLLVLMIMLLLHSLPREGDFAIKAASAAVRSSTDFGQLPTIKIRLRADAQGTLAGISMNQRTIKNLDELAAEIRAIVHDAGGSPEVEFDCDYNLSYDATMRAITAVSGYVADDGRTLVKLVDRIKFAPRRKAGGEK